MTECKYIKNRRYCKINGKWVPEDEKYKVAVSSETPIKVHKNVKTRKGVC